MPGFDEVLRAVDDAWQNRREHAEDMGDQLVAELKKMETSAAGAERRALARAHRRRGDGSSRARSTQRGAASAARQSSRTPWTCSSCCDTGAARAVSNRSTWSTTTLDRMAAGGIYDHLGGGFARYSVDARWLVPHFEKMLYDNALLAAAYVEAFQATGNADYARVVRETLDYILRDMTDPAGGFYSTEDADSEGEEGKFYVWTPDEVDAVLGDEAGAIFGRVYDVSDAGNFEGAQHPQHAEDARAVRRHPEHARG